MDIRTRIKKSFTAVPFSLLSASHCLDEIGGKQKTIDEIKNELDAKVEKLKREASKQVGAITKDRDTLTSALFAYAQAKRVLLTVRSKTISVAAGVFGWRFTPPAVTTEETDEVIIARLKRNGLREYIRVKEELDREKLLADKPVIRGVDYTQHEEFFVVPNTESEKRTITVAIDA